MKNYVLTVSITFPKTHKRAGDPTYFKEKLINGLAQLQGEDCKIHTIRANYELWAKRIKEIQEGKAILSIRYWSGKPYNSKQVEICQLDKNSGIGTQLLYVDSVTLCEGKETPLYATVYQPFEYKFSPPLIYLALNDGLSLDDFKEWFKKYDLSKPMAIIHFTPFRY